MMAADDGGGGGKTWYVFTAQSLPLGASMAGTSRWMMAAVAGRRGHLFSPSRFRWSQLEHSSTAVALDDESRVSLPPESAVRDFLSALVMEGNCAPKAQNQAKSSLLFLYQSIFGRDVGFPDMMPPGKAKRLPVVLSRPHTEGVFRRLRKLPARYFSDRTF